MEYRVGRKLGRTIYRDEHLIGIMDSVEDAEFFVAIANKYLTEDPSAVHEMLRLIRVSKDIMSTACEKLDELLLEKPCEPQV